MLTRLIEFLRTGRRAYRPDVVIFPRLRRPIVLPATRYRVFRPGRREGNLRRDEP